MYRGVDVHEESSTNGPRYKCTTFSPYDRSPFYIQLLNVLQYIYHSRNGKNT